MTESKLEPIKESGGILGQPKAGAKTQATGIFSHPQATKSKETAEKPSSLFGLNQTTPVLATQKTETITTGLFKESKPIEKKEIEVGIFGSKKTVAPAAGEK